MIMQASEILYYLSQRRWIGGGCSETAVLRAHPPGPGEGSWPYSRTWGACGCWRSSSVVDGFLTPFMGAYSSHLTAFAIKLPRAPLTGITAVLQNGATFTDWRLARNGYLERTDGLPWNLCDDSTQVTYTFGEPPPEAGVQAAVALAVQLGRARAGDDNCALPERVQTVTRQGITVSVLDPQEFLQQGRVGIYEVDLFLAAVNPYGRAQRGRVYSPDIAAAF